MKKEELKHSRQYKRHLNNNTYVTVPVAFCARFNLSPTELLIYCYVKMATDNAPLRTYSGSLKGLCVICNVSMPTAKKALDKLIKEGFIYKEYKDKIFENGTRVETQCYTAYELKSREKTFEEVLSVNKFRNERREQNNEVIVNGQLVRRNK